jgi:hypothetical protein
MPSLQSGEEHKMNNKECQATDMGYYTYTIVVRDQWLGGLQSQTIAII